MLSWLTVVVLAATAAFGLTALVYALLRRPLDDRLLLALGVLEVALLAQVVVGIIQATSTTRDYEGAVFFAYLLTVPVIPPVASFVALKEKTQPAMLVVAGSALVVGILVGRLSQIWGSHV